MTETLQYSLVTAILLMAVGYLVRRGWQQLRGKGGCARGCTACPRAEQSLVTLVTPPRLADRE